MSPKPQESDGSKKKIVKKYQFSLGLKRGRIGQVNI